MRYTPDIGMEPRGYPEQALAHSPLTGTPELLGTNRDMGSVTKCRVDPKRGSQGEPNVTEVRLKMVF